MFGETFWLGWLMIVALLYSGIPPVPWTLILSLNIVFALVGGAGIGVLMLVDLPASYPFLLTAWSPLDGETISIVCMLAAISIGIHIFLARAYQLGPMSIVAGLDFSYLGFAAVWAFVLFGTVPDTSTVIGTVLIGAAGLWGVLRQRRL